LAPWDLLTPFAQYGQSLSLVFVASISLSLLFQSYECLRSIEGVIIYSSLVIIALTLFFMSIGRSTTHLRRHKRRSWPGCDETWPARAKLCVSARPVTQHGPCATDIVRWWSAAFTRGRCSTHRPGRSIQRSSGDGSRPR